HEVAESDDSEDEQPLSWKGKLAKINGGCLEGKPSQNNLKKKTVKRVFLEEEVEPKNVLDPEEHGTVLSQPSTARSM
ncbi:hypothetical protein HAX54_027096, partial [Datura stramonium]|nr:hypothetical protein [Datura stramonium]